jgi:3-hydroxy-9,10-secoandrosta-1,3,5(10)-triene-9,17-dione monooxygenase
VGTTSTDAPGATTLQRSPKAEGAKLIEAARGLAPVLAERAAIVDHERRVPDETFAAIQEAGLLRAFKPKRFGGYELGLWEHTRIAFELAVGCSSSSWVFSLLNEHSWFVSMFPVEAQDEVWSADPSACCAASIRVDASRAGARRVPGGYRVSGRFPFMSGSDHAVWGLLAAVVQPEDGESPTAYTFLVPKSELAMVDDWFVLGMRGTGSRSYVADDVFVPQHRAVPYDDLWNGRGPGIGSHPDWPFITAPKSQLTAYVTSAPVIGIAAGAIEAFRQAVAHRPGMGTWPTVQLRFAESTSELFAAKALMDADVRDQMAYIDRREPLPLDLQLRCRRNASYVGLLAWRCVERLHATAGVQASGFEGTPLERAFRDSKMAVMQFGLQWETQAPGFSIWAFDNPGAPI